MYFYPCLNLPFGVLCNLRKKIKNCVQFTIYIHDVHVYIHKYICIQFDHGKEFLLFNFTIHHQCGRIYNKQNKKHKANFAPSPMSLLNPHPSKVIFHAIYQYPEFTYWFTINIQILQYKLSCIVCI